MKICKKCGVEKPLNDFEKAKTCKDGYANTCKKCRLESKKKYINICETCGEEFRTMRKETKYCSKKCLPQNQTKPKVTKCCDWCGKLFERNASTFENRKHFYCSKECNSLHQSVLYKGENSHRYNSKVVRCDNCGEEFTRVKSQIDKYKYNYCSRECKYEHQAIVQSGENHPRYNKELTREDREHTRKYQEYYEWRFKVFERDKFTCVKCGFDGGHTLNAHHIENYMENVELRTDINNGITFCEECHKNFHIKYGYSNNNRNQLENFLNLC